MGKKDNKQLDNNGSDWTALIAKGGLGAIPFAGGFLAELAGALIPNQRIDRIAKYLKELNDQLSKLPEEVIERLRNNEQFIDLVEESFIRAARAGSEDRRKYILHIIQNGISNDQADFNDTKYLLCLLSELNDNEVIWLRYFHERTINQKEEFRALHQNVLSRVIVTMGSNKDERQQGAVQKSYEEHLERLGLIEHNIRMNKDLGVPEYDTFTNKPKVSYSHTTTLGDMLLEFIGLLEK